MDGELADYRDRYASIRRSVGVPVPFDLGVFCGNVARSRGRRVELRQLRSGRICGLYVALPGVDHVFFAPGSSPLHEQHIVVHELMHMLLEHGGSRGPALSPGVLERLLPGLDRALVRAALARDGYSDPEEREAETLASLVLDHARHQPADTSPDVVAARIESAFG